VPTLGGLIRWDGAVVGIEVGLSQKNAAQLRAALRPVPPALVKQALLDTGAESTALDHRVVQQLGLQAIQATPANAPAAGGLKLVPVHSVDLTMLHPSGNPRLHLVARNLIVLELDLGPLGYEALIGRDILTRCSFLFDGRAGQFELTY
jgi:predicted aspartyl protease